MFNLTSLKALFLLVLLGIATSDITDENAVRSIIKIWRRGTYDREVVDHVELQKRQYGKYIYENLKKFDWKNFSDPLLKRKVEVLLRGDGYPVLTQELLNAVNFLQNVAHERWVCDRNHTEKCNLAFVPQIKAIFTNVQDPTELLYYWREWRERMPTTVKTALNTYIDYYRNAVHDQYTNTSGLWYSDYDDEHTFEMFEEVWESILPLYKELHAHLRQLLKQRYGDNIVPASGLIPHHLLQKAAYQAWKKHSILSNPYTSKPLPNLQVEIEKIYPDSRKFINTSLEFFESLGFESHGSDFIKKHFTELEYSGHDCKAVINEQKNQVNYCAQINYKKLLQMHGYVARLEYNLGKSNFTVGLDQETAPGFSDAVAEATILSVSNPKHIQKTIHLLEDYNYDEQRNLNRLYRMAVHTLLTLPAYLVNERLWIDIINGKVTPEQYNCHYWDLMQKYMGVDAPVQTLPGTYDMPDKFYEGIFHETSSTRKLFGEFMGYRLYRDICQHIGEFQPGNPNKLLDHCDWTNNKEAGVILRQLMSFGSKKPWKEAIKSLPFASKSEADGSAFLQYYDPVWKWLKADNIENGVPVGWQTVKRC